jgi:hypothetical protein
MDVRCIIANGVCTLLMVSSVTFTVSRLPRFGPQFGKPLTLAKTRHHPGKREEVNANLSHLEPLGHHLRS